MSRTHRFCSLLSTLACALVVLSASPAFAASVGDPEIKTDNTYFPGELEMSTPFRVLTHAQIVVGAPDHHLVDMAVAIVPGHRELAAPAFQIGEQIFVVAHIA